MSRPLLSVIIPTIGRKTLARTLASIRAQARPSECELLVVGDSHEDTFRDALHSAYITTAVYAARYSEHDGGQHCVGQPQRNFGMLLASGHWLAFSQDDAVWRPGAYTAIYSALCDPPPVPRLFRVEVRPGFTVWQRAGDLYEGGIDADCIVTPNVPEKLGRWGLRQAGDWNFIRDTVALWDGHVRWGDVVIAEGRPA